MLSTTSTSSSSTHKFTALGSPPIWKKKGKKLSCISFLSCALLWLRLTTLLSKLKIRSGKIASLLVLEHYHNQTEISKKLWREIFSAIWTLNLLVAGSYDLYYNITCTGLYREKQKNKNLKHCQADWVQKWIIKEEQFETLEKRCWSLKTLIAPSYFRSLKNHGTVPLSKRI